MAQPDITQRPSRWTLLAVHVLDTLLWAALTVLSAFYAPLLFNLVLPVEGSKVLIVCTFLIGAIVPTVLLTFFVKSLRMSPVMGLFGLHIVSVHHPGRFEWWQALFYVRGLNLFVLTFLPGYFIFLSGILKLTAVEQLASLVVGNELSYFEVEGMTYVQHRW